MLAGLLLVAAACDGDPADSADESSSTVTDTAPVATGTTDAPTPADGSLFPAGDIDAGLQPWIDDATADLASRLGVDPGAIVAISGVLVVWPDAALGCPEPDAQYATVVTDGAVIELAAGDAIYRYHAGGDRTPFLCSAPITAPPSRL